jgi:hypothetical protein
MRLLPGSGERKGITAQSPLAGLRRKRIRIRRRLDKMVRRLRASGFADLVGELLVTRTCEGWGPLAGWRAVVRAVGA